MHLSSWRSSTELARLVWLTVAAIRRVSATSLITTPATNFRRKQRRHLSAFRQRQLPYGKVQIQAHFCRHRLQTEKLVYDSSAGSHDYFMLPAHAERARATHGYDVGSWCTHPHTTPTFSDHVLQDRKSSNSLLCSLSFEGYTILRSCKPRLIWTGKCITLIGASRQGDRWTECTCIANYISRVCHNQRTRSFILSQYRWTCKGMGCDERVCSNFHQTEQNSREKLRKPSDFNETRKSFLARDWSGQRYVLRMEPGCKHGRHAASSSISRTHAAFARQNAHIRRRQRAVSSRHN